MSSSYPSIDKPGIIGIIKLTKMSGLPANSFIQSIMPLKRIIEKYFYAFVELSCWGGFLLRNLYNILALKK